MSSSNVFLSGGFRSLVGGGGRFGIDARDLLSLSGAFAIVDSAVRLVDGSHGARHAVSAIMALREGLSFLTAASLSVDRACSVTLPQEIVRLVKSRMTP